MELYHFGTKGQKKGVRRFQNLDGTWTEAGLDRRRKSYANGIRKKAASIYKARGISDYDGKAADDAFADWEMRKYAVKKAKKILNADQKERLLKTHEKASAAQVKYRFAEREAVRLADQIYEEYHDGKRWQDNYKTYMNADPSLKKEMKKTRAAYFKECRKITDELLGAYGNAPVTTLRDDITSRRVKDIVAASLENTNWPDEFK